MKRLYTMLLGALLPLAGWAAKDLPYASNLYQGYGVDDEKRE